MMVRKLEMWKHGWRKWVILCLLCYTAVHFAFSGLYAPMFILTGMEKTGQVREEAEPLRLFFTEGKAITLDNPRQYGPVFLFVMSPILLLSKNSGMFETILLFLGYAAIGLALYLTYRLLDVPRSSRGLFLALLIILWLNFSSLYYILAVKNVETWELLLLCLALLALCRQRAVLAGFSIAAATLIKLLPGIFFLYAIIKNRKVFWYGLCALLGMLLLSQALFGWYVGLGYLPLVFAGGMGKESWAAAHFENNAIRGVVYKLSSGFQPQEGYPYLFTLSERGADWAFLLSLSLQTLLVLFVGWVLWRHRHDHRNGTLLNEFGLVSAAMLLLSPVAALEYATLLLLAFSIGLYGIVFRKMRKSLIGIGVGAYILLGHFIPFGIFLRFLPLRGAGEALGIGMYSTDELYKAFGFPFMGFLLLFIFFSVLLLSSNRASEKPLRNHFHPQHEVYIHQLFKVAEKR